jgi:DNA gyrase subunit B
MEGFGPGVWGHHLCVANALSAHIAVTTWWKGREYSMTYAEGEAIAPLRDRSPAPPGARGARIELKPSPTIFSDPRLSYKLMALNLRELNKLHPDVRFVLDDPREPPRSGADGAGGVRKDKVA